METPFEPADPPEGQPGTGTSTGGSSSQPIPADPPDNQGGGSSTTDSDI